MVHFHAKVRIPVQPWHRGGRMGQNLNYRRGAIERMG